MGKKSRPKPRKATDDAQTLREQIRLAIETLGRMEKELSTVIKPARRKPMLTRIGEWFSTPKPTTKKAKKKQPEKRA